MIRQLWASGILAAFSVFGIKAGLGLAARLFHKNVSFRGKATVVTAAFGGYGLLFLGLHGLTTRLRPADYLNHLLEMLGYGMLLHFAMALGLFLWGAGLLLGTRKKVLPSRGGLLLIFPCPVCGIVIWLNLSLADTLFAMPPVSTTLLLYGLFSGIIMVSLAVVFLFRNRIQSTETFLGLSMVLVALYFLFTVMIAPIYPEIKAAFDMAVSNAPSGQTDKRPTIILAAVTIVLGCAGFLKAYLNIGGKK